MTVDKNILSIDSDDDNDNYQAFSEYLEDHAKRQKNKTAHEIEQMGNLFLSEIERKNKIKKLKSEKLIPYILKHCDDRYGEEQLKSYSFEDIQQIYDEIKAERKPMIVKFFHFIFNL